MTRRLATMFSLCILTLAPAAALAINTGVDGTFGPDAGHYRYNRASFSESVHDTAVDSQGRILLAFLLQDASSPGTYWPAIMRLTADGYGDTSFGFLGLWFESTVDATPECTVAIAVDASDRPILGWTYEFNQGEALNRDWYIRRLTTSGALDTAQVLAFDIGINNSGDRLDELTDLRVLSDGRIVAVGGAQYNGTDWDFAVGMIKDDGAGGLTLDTAFDGDGRRTVPFDLDGSSKYDNAAAVTTDSTGNIVVVGWSHSSSGNVVSACRLDRASGLYDSSFDSDGKANYSYAPLFDPALPSRGVEVAALSSGFLIGAVLTDVSFDRVGVIKIQSDGSADLTFGVTGWFYRAPIYPGQPFSSASTALTGLAVDNDRFILSATITDPLDPYQSQGIVMVSTLSGAADTRFTPSGMDYYAFEPEGEATRTAFSSVVVPGLAMIGTSVGKAVLVGATAGVSAGASRSDTDLLATEIITTGALLVDGFESGDFANWSSVVGSP